MTTPGASFEIKVDSVTRSYRDVRETAIEAARLLQQRNPGGRIVLTACRGRGPSPEEYPHDDRKQKERDNEYKSAGECRHRAGPPVHSVYVGLIWGSRE
jgi:hypothetical protein